MVEDSDQPCFWQSSRGQNAIGADIEKPEYECVYLPREEFYHLEVVTHNGITSFV